MINEFFIKETFKYVDKFSIDNQEVIQEVFVRTSIYDFIIKASCEKGLYSGNALITSYEYKKIPVEKTVNFLMIQDRQVKMIGNTPYFSIEFKDKTLKELSEILTHF